MKVAILTTDTLSHRFFVREVAKEHNVGVFLEAEPAEKPGFICPFPVSRREHEEETWGLISWGGYIKVAVENLNEAFAVSELRRFAPDVILVNGTLKLDKPILDIRPFHIVNFHSGWPEKYRGLDNDLWAVWHKDWFNLCVCAHRVTEKLDTGRIIGSHLIEAPDGLYALRLRKAEVAVKVAHGVLQSFKRNCVQGREYVPGRYYGAMPTVLQEEVDRILQRRAKKDDE